MTDTSGLKHPYVIISALVALLGFGYAAFGAYQSYLTIRGGDGALIEPTQQAKQGTRQNVSLNKVISAHLFGHKTAAAKPVAAKATKTRLNLVLEGVISANSPDYARAIIAIDKKQSQPYSVGQSLEGVNAKIHSIESQKVLLSRNGKLESLEIERGDLVASNSPSVVPASTTSTTNINSTKNSPQQAAKIRKQRRIQSKLKRLESAMPELPQPTGISPHPGQS